MRRVLQIAGLVVALGVVFGLLVSLIAPPTSDRARDEPEGKRELFHLEDHESGFYPYLSSRRAFANLSPINVVVAANLTETRSVLQEQPGSEWNTTRRVDDEANQTGPLVVNLSGTDIDWGQATGSARYAYVHDGQTGAWERDSAQLHDGDYFGYRYHMRMYESPAEDEDWVAIQAHSEHLDWFTLRHAVDGVQEAQTRVEEDLMGQPYIDRVWRAHLDNDGSSDSDGWATVVELAIVAPLVALGAVGNARSPSVQETASETAHEAWRRARDRIGPRHGVLAATIAALLLGVRAGGIALERGTGLTPYEIGGLLYPFLAFGLPIATYAIAHRLERRMDAAMVAPGALGGAILVDYAYLGVDVLPLDLIVHRVVLVIALGLIAAGAARRAARERRFNATLGVGCGLWVVLLTLTLAGWL
jgi:hypothetical protein